MKDSTREKLETLLSAQIDESLSQAQAEELNYLLRDAPENRRFYLRYMDVQSRLSNDPSESATIVDWHEILSELASSEPVADADAQMRASSNRSPQFGFDPSIELRKSGNTPRFWTVTLPWVFAIAATSACLWMGFALRWGNFLDNAKSAAHMVPKPNPKAETRSPAPDVNLPKPSGENAVRLVSAAGAELFNERLPEIGDTIKYGREYTLVEGLVSLEFPCGAQAILEAPSIIEIAGPMRLVVKIGRCSVYAPDGAEGFQVETPDNKIVDLGTRFSVSVDDDGVANVQVVDGIAEVSPLEMEHPATRKVRLVERQARRVEGASVQPIEFDDRQYQAALPDRVIGYRVEDLTTPSTVLSSVEVQRAGKSYVYQGDDLIRSKMVHFRASVSRYRLCVASDIAPKDLKTVLDTGLVLNTGWINPGGSNSPLTGSPQMRTAGNTLTATEVLANDREPQLGTFGLGVEFEQPIMNGPGPEVVLFEIQSRIEAPAGDVFHVSPLVWRDGLRAQTISRYDLTTKTPGVVPVSPFQLVMHNDPWLTLDELINKPFDVYTPAKTFYAIAVGIDLSDLGYREGEEVKGLFLQDADDDETQFDPTLILGLPTIDQGAQE